MKTILGTLVAIFGIMTLATGCSTQVRESAQSGILADGEFSTDSINVLPFSRGKFLKIDGSSTVFLISYEAARRYQQKVSDAPAVAVSFSGTSAGFKKFCAGETDINDASRPINPKEIKACKANGVKYIELPIALDAVTLVVNPENTWAEDITIPELAKIWQPEAEGQIENWSQIRQSWPERPLNLYGPGKDSGTFDYFTEVVVGETGASRQDYTKSEDDSLLVEKVSKDPNGLGYFGLGYYAANWNRLKSLAVDNGQQLSQPTVNAVKTFKYQPLTRPLFIYVNAENVQNKSELQEFIEYYVEDVRKWVPFVGYVPLEKETYKLVSQRFQQQIIGTVYGGELQSEVPIEQMLQRESVF
ncbi:MAG: PstS family phosphate ABC transporter substrate-binding protein [Xenococcaceae cyanobacterium MO_234.B1]|nr:PstS family phosphate ABC transporter substrate-binding protein [Xenococcaceae cyanobacterium MO_234.B1]